MRVVGLGVKEEGAVVGVRGNEIPVEQRRTSSPPPPTLPLFARIRSIQLCLDILSGGNYHNQNFYSSAVDAVYTDSSHIF